MLWSVPSYEMLQTTHFTNKEINEETSDIGIVNKDTGSGYYIASV